MNININFVLLVVVFSLTEVCFTESAFDKNDFKDCVLVPLEETEFNKGETFDLGCNDFMVEVEYSGDDYLEGSYECFTVVGNDTILHEENGTFPVGYDTSYSNPSDILFEDIIFFKYAKIYFSPNDTTCFYTKADLQVKSSKQNCQQDLDEKYESKEEKTVYVQCTDNFLTLDHEVKIGFPDNVTWLAGCEAIESKHYFVKKTGAYLQLPVNENLPRNISVNESDGNNFKYTHYRTCFLEGRDYQTMSIQASYEIFEAEFNTDVQLQCNITNGFDVEIFWKNSTSQVACALADHEGSWQNRKYFCSRTAHKQVTMSWCKDFSICKNRDTMVTTTLIIRNITERELGNYTCVAETPQEQKSDQILVRLRKNNLQNSGPSETVLTVFVILAAVCLVSLLVFLVIWKYIKTDLKLLWKKYYTRYESEVRLFDVFLSYSISMNNQTDIKELLNIFHSWFDLHTYKVFDQHRSHAGELQFNLTFEIIAKSHRMLIILTPEYLESEKQLFDINTGIIGCITGITKLVFVVLPEAQTYIKNKLKVKDPVCLSLLMAMKHKGNTVIMWQENMKEHKFLKQIDVAMPKLRAVPLIVTNTCTEKNEKDLPSPSKLPLCILENETKVF